MEQPTKLIALGDSVTAGCSFSQVTTETCYVHRVSQRLLASGLQVEVTASALEGIDTGYAVKRFNRLVTLLEPDLVTIMLGLNDALPPGNRPAISPDEYHRNLLGLIDRILSLDARPILLTPNPRPAAAGCSTNLMQPYAAAARAAADHFQLGYVDVYSLFISHGDISQLVPDGTHPSPVGHQIIADHLSAHLCHLVQTQPPTPWTATPTAEVVSAESGQAPQA